MQIYTLRRFNTLYRVSFVFGWKVNYFDFKANYFGMLILNIHEILLVSMIHLKKIIHSYIAYNLESSLFFKIKTLNDTEIEIKRIKFVNGTQLFIFYMDIISIFFINQTLFIVYLYQEMREKNLSSGSCCYIVLKIVFNLTQQRERTIMVSKTWFIYFIK